MTKDKLTNFSKNATLAKQKKVLAVTDGININSTKGNQMQNTDSYSLCSLGKTIRNTLLELYKVREINLKRRHNELMEMLAKLIQQEGTATNEATNTRKLNSNTYIGKHSKRSSAIINSAKQDFVEIEDLAINGEVPNFTNILMFANTENVLNKKNQSGANIDADNLSSTLKLLPRSQINNQLTMKSSYNPVRHDDESIKQLQIMRSRMLKFHREKMEDREK